MKTHPLILLAALSVTLTGCLQTHEERIYVRREYKEAQEADREVRDDDYEEWLLARQLELEKLRLTPMLNREFNHHKLTRLKVNQALTTIPEDPFASYEKDRVDHLHRWWKDHDYAPPEPDPDVMVAVKKAEDPDAAEEGEGDEGDEGDEGEGDGEDEGFDDEDDEDYDDEDEDWDDE